MAAVTMRRIEKVYSNGFKAVHGLDLHIDDGEFMVFVGPSGCAKSTTLRMIAGLESISAGELFIGGKTVNDLAPKDRGIAMVFQNYALYPHMTAYQNMAFGLKQLKLSSVDIKERINKVAETLDIAHLLQHKPSQMSGGQRQRVALGRAIVRKPDVFLFDEPLSNLDAKLRVSTRIGIAKLHQELKANGQQATMIYVTHDQVEAMTLGDRICVLDQGRIMQVDTPMNLYRYPANKFVAGFIGSPGMNFFSGVLECSDGIWFVVIGAYRLKLPLHVMRRLNGQAGQPIWFGIRPEHICIAPSGQNDMETCIDVVTVDVVEAMGNEQYIYFKWQGSSWIARANVGENLIGVGSQVAIHFEMKHVQIFDQASELSLLESTI
ncbi:MAG: Oligosaccharides import ATP-binding protein MsmX [Candidatus Celerinatantimonas neptuna]|nr:MAG: Oligosaccharides import ATP-binding protein MsmX [Candidatus Celerinatantimonas neptuna]